MEKERLDRPERLEDLNELSISQEINRRGIETCLNVMRNNITNPVRKIVDEKLELFLKALKASQ